MELITARTEVLDKLIVVNLANVMGEEMKHAVILTDLVQWEREFVRMTQIVNLILSVDIKIVLNTLLIKRKIVVNIPVREKTTAAIASNLVKKERVFANMTQIVNLILSVVRTIVMEIYLF